MTTTLVRQICLFVSGLSCALICESQVEAQFAFITNNGSITITGYSGPGGNVIIPATTNGYPVTAIGQQAFYNQGAVTSVMIPNGVTSLGGGAFQSCAGLTNVTIPNGVSSLGVEAFYGCSGLLSVTIPNSVTNLGGSEFDECTALTNVTIGCSVISGSMFRYCFGLTSVTIPNTVTSIGDHAFLRCSSLTNLIIGSGVTNIGAYAFSECYVLQQAYFRGNAPSVEGGPGSADSTVFYPNQPFVPAGTVYYVPGTMGWGATFGGWPTAGWYQPLPQILGAGRQIGGFQFTISWATNGSVVVEACTNLAKPVWTALATNVLVNGTNYFNDPQYMGFPKRFYRARAQ